VRPLKKQKKNVAIVYRPRKKEAKDLATKIAKFLKTEGHTAFSHPDQARITGAKAATPADLKNLDFVLVLGGDGTYLNAVRMVSKSPIPILGVNLGSLGFLTPTPKSKALAVVKSALQGKLEVSKRTLLEVEVQRKGKRRACFQALNDIVFERGPVSRLIYMSIHVDGALVSELKADGLIVSTPTGSTAYNLAAGGPILYPGIGATVITPICPHSLTNRPLTISNQQVIELKLTASDQKAVFMVDGQRETDITTDDTIVIRKHTEEHQMLVAPDFNHFDILRSKLRFGQRD